MCIRDRRIPLLSEHLVYLMFSLSVLFTLIVIYFYPKERKLWLGVSAIGLLVAALFFIESMWAPSRLIQDMGRTVVEGRTAPDLYRIYLAMMMLIGMRISVVVYKEQRFRWPTVYKFMRHTLGGLMMGVGGAIALGGNDAQILMGMPALSFGAMTAIAFMLLGIASEQYLYSHYHSFKSRLFSKAPSA